MRLIIIISILFLFIDSNAQFKDDLGKTTNYRGSITNNQPSQFFLSFIDPNKFSMHHSISMSYTAMGNQGLSLGVYTNTMSYQFSDNLDLSVDASLVTSPYNTFGDEFTNRLNGLYLSRAELNYRVADNMEIKLQYYRPPTGINPYYGYYRDSFWR